MTLDLNFSPLYRINGQEPASMPGLLAMTPPRKAARGREQDRLIVYLLLTGNASLTTAEYMQFASEAASAFYQTPGALTTAMRNAADSVNRALLERNISTSGRGQYAICWLALGALRESQFTLLLSGPIHEYTLSQSETKHIHEPALSGKGLGLGQTLTHYFTQASLQPGDRIVLCGEIPIGWETALMDHSPASLEITRRRLLTATSDDLNAVMMQEMDGSGLLNQLQQATQETPQRATFELPREQGAESQPQVAPISAHLLQPSAYAIPVQQEEEPVPGKETYTPAITARELPPSLPRAKRQTRNPEPPAEENIPQIIEQKKTMVRREPSQQTRQAAKAAASGMQAWRRGSERVGTGVQRFLPRLLPGAESSESFTLPPFMLTFIAVLIPLIVVTIASTVYLRYGRSAQCETYLQQARDARTSAANFADPIMQRDAWRSVYLSADKAEACRETAETRTIKQEAEAKLDQLLGIIRMQFNPVFNSGLGIQISRMAASETDLFLLDAQTGNVKRAALTNRGFELDDTFDCKPGRYSDYQVGQIVDMLALPLLNSINATLLGVDTTGNLLYCAPGQVAQAIPLPPPDTNWGRVTALTLDAGNLYVMDAPARAVWVYTGKDGTFIDRPYFFFGGQIPEIQDAIDMAVSGDELYILHSDGHLSVCSYSRIETVPTRCQDPASLVNPLGAYKDTDLFSRAHITQMMFTVPPDSSILLLDADNQSILRFTPRSLELQNQLRPTTGVSNPISQGSVDAMTAGPNHVLYLA
ncbi:MAG: hypothetical protein MUO77_21115, partial [Anaerolineales bacterium]|nr:hypothetical protein [Anaerolineales bacterium]